MSCAYVYERGSKAGQKCIASVYHKCSQKKFCSRHYTVATEEQQSPVEERKDDKNEEPTTFTADEQTDIVAMINEVLGGIQAKIMHINIKLKPSAQVKEALTALYDELDATKLTL